MKNSQGQKDKRKNYGPSKRIVNYIPKSHRTVDSVAAASAALATSTSEPPSKPTTTSASETSGNEVTTKAQPSYGKLTRTLMLSLYVKRPVPTHILDGIRGLKDVYSEESISPAGLSEFTLPMSKAIMPPRKMGPYESKPSHAGHHDSRRPEEEYSENDQGIVSATDNSHSNLNNAPLWFDSDTTSGKLPDMKDDGGFTMEDMARRQLSLEEEKAKFMKNEADAAKPAENNGNKNKGTAKETNAAVTTKQKELGTKVELDSIFDKLGADDEGEYSSIDVKYERALKGNTTTNKIAAELFSDPAIASSGDTTAVAHANAIDAKSLEAEILKGAKQEELEDDTGEEKPVWDAFSAEEIKQQSQKNMDNWGLTLIQDKDSLSTVRKEQMRSGEKFNSMAAGADPAIAGRGYNITTNGITSPAANSSNGLIGATAGAIKKPYMEEPQPAPVKVENKNPFCHSSLNIKETDRVWYYKDIQNCIQGPFTSIDMYMWYKAGYFPSDLPVSCGEHAPFIPLGDFMNSIKPKAPPQPVQHFDHSNMAAFFDSSAYVPNPMMAAPVRAVPTTISLEELEGRFRPLERIHSEPIPYAAPLEPTRGMYYQPQPVPRYIAPATIGISMPAVYYAPQPARQPYEDPAIASARIGGTIEAAPQSDATTGYVTEEANDLKALLGMSGNSKPVYR